MALIQNHFFSGALTESSSMNIIIPAESCQKEKYPVLWLIPPAGYDHTSWSRYTDVECLANEMGIMVVMPDMKLSYGLDMAHGFAYFKMLTQGLPELIKEYFPADMEMQMIAGAEEGAYTALMAAFQFPENYQKVIACSCGSLTDEDFEGEVRRNIENAFGTGSMSELLGTEYSLAYWMKKRGEKLPPVYLSYSFNDKYCHSAELLKAELEKIQKNHVEVFSTRLTWSEWSQLLRKNVSLGTKWIA